MDNLKVSYLSEESLTNQESPTLSLRSEPVTRSNLCLSLDSDDSSNNSSTEILDRISFLRMFSSDSQSLSDISPISLPDNYPTFVSQRLNFGKKRMAPQPPIIKINHRREHSEPTMDEVNLLKMGNLSKSEERLDDILSIERKRERTKSSEFPLRYSIGESSLRVRGEQSTRRKKLKAAFRIAAFHASPNMGRRGSRKKSREEPQHEKKNVRTRKNATVEQPDMEQYLYSIAVISPELRDIDTEFEVQRIPEYDKYLNDLLEETVPSHPDYDDLSKAASRAKTMVREHEDELGTNNDQIKMDRIQQRFPNDDLQLRDYNSTQNLRSLSTRRKSAPSAVLFKTLGKSKSSSNLWSSNSMGKKEMDSASSLRHSSNLNRQFILEGHAEFACGVQTQDRYLFLFNDLLLVAKQKSSTTFKLKHRIRVCEMWLATCIYDVSEIKLPADRSFVIGWPTVNMVATFKSMELKELWLNKLNETIELERMKEANKSVKIKVHSREMDQTCTLEVSNQTTAKDILIQCIGKFHITDTDLNESQLWVKTGKDESPYPLIGHELPHSIKSSHLRDLANTDDPMVSLDLEQGMEDVTGEKKCEFIFKHGKFAKKQSFDESKVKKNKKSPLMNLFKRNKDDKNNNSTPVGKFFGHPLQNDMEISFPKTVLEILRILFQNAPYTKGIFRKSCNAKLSREIHEKLDEGIDCISEETPTLVVGALLKDYLRSLPHCLLVEDYYDDWMALSEEMESTEKQNKVRELIEKLPEEHRALLKHLVCVLYYIDKRNEENMMTSYNLSVCITPSILWPKTPKEQQKVLQMAKTPTSIVQYLIDNCIELMGEDTLYLFGDPLEHKVRQDSSTDSDSMHSVLSMPDSAGGSNFRRDDSSIDSLERDLYMAEIDSSPNLAKNHISPSSLSRDSGLYSSQENLDTAKPRGTTLVKSQSGSHLYFNSDDCSYVTEIDIHPNRGNQNRIQRQKSLVDSTPPNSPQSKLSSYSSFDSSLTESSSYFRQFSTNTDNSEQWFTANESLRGSFDSHESHDDSSLNLLHSSGSSASSVPKSVQNVRYLVSPPASPKSSRKSNISDSHPTLSERRSYPLSLSTTSLEKSSESLPYRYGQSAIELSSSATSAALKELSRPMYSMTLGSSPPPRLVLHNIQKNSSQKRETSNLPMRASYDSAIISQVTENESYRSELHKKQFTPVSKSESESESDKTITNSPDTPSSKPRPVKPPSYDEAVKRKNMIKSGKMPVEISEQDIKREKEASEKAKQLYQESLRKYQQESERHKIEEEEYDDTEEDSCEEEDVYVCLKNPRLLYEESMKKYEEQTYSRPSPSKDSGSFKIENKHLKVPVCNLHRSHSDSADYANKDIVHRRRDASPKSRLSNSPKRDSSPITRLSHSSSSVSNSSSDTVTDAQRVSPVLRERSECSPVSSRHQFQTTSHSTFTAQYSHKNSAQVDSSSDSCSRSPSRDNTSSKRLSRELLSQSLDFSSPQKSEQSARTNSYRDVKSVSSNVSTPRRDMSPSQWRDGSPSPRKNTGPKDVKERKSCLSKSLEMERSKEIRTAIDSARDLASSKLSRGRDTSVKHSPFRDSYPSANISRTPDSSLSTSASRESSESRKTQRSKDLPWSVQSLKQIYDQGGANQSATKTTGSRPPPPPYQPPPPFRRPDTSRMSSSSQSSVGSGSTGRSSPPMKSSNNQRRSGGPQAMGYSSAEDSDVSYV